MNKIVSKSFNTTSSLFIKQSKNRYDLYTANRIKIVENQMKIMKEIEERKKVEDELFQQEILKQEKLMLQEQKTLEDELRKQEKLILQEEKRAKFKRSRNSNIEDVITDPSMFVVSKCFIQNNKFMFMIEDVLYISSTINGLLCLRPACTVCKQSIIRKNDAMCKTCKKIDDCGDEDYNPTGYKKVKRSKTSSRRQPYKLRNNDASLAKILEKKLMFDD